MELIHDISKLIYCILHMLGLCHSEIKGVLLRGLCFRDLNWNRSSNEVYFTVLMVYVYKVLYVHVF